MLYQYEGRKANANAQSVSSFYVNIKVQIYQIQLLTAMNWLFQPHHHSTLLFLSVALTF